MFDRGKAFIIRKFKNGRRLAKKHIFTIIILICLVILFFISIDDGINWENVLEAFKISVTVSISMLGFSVSIYVFLNNTFQNRRHNTIEAEMIELFQRKKRESLGIRIVFSLVIVVTEWVIIAFDNSLEKWLSDTSASVNQVMCVVCFFSCVTLTLVNVLLLGSFTYGVINYEEGIKKLAKEKRKSYNNQSYYQKIQKGKFLDLVNNIEVLSERLVANHLHAKTSNADDFGLKRAICDGITNSGELVTREELAKDYQEIIEYRNILLQDQDMKDSDDVDLGDKVNSVKDRLFQKYFVNELLTGVSISNLEITEGNLSKTSFSNSSLQGIIFKGKTVLCNTDFRNSTLNDIKFEEAECENINFSDSKLIGVKLNSKMRLERAIFTNADLSSMEIIGPDDKEGSPIGMDHANFGMANLTHLDIYNVSFNFANFSNARLVDSKIGASAQKQNNTTFKYAIMTGADMLKCAIERCSFQNADLNEAILTHTHIKQVDMSECKLNRATFAASNIKKCQFDKAYCKNMSLKGSEITSSTFSFATMISADMSGAKFCDARFIDAVCRDALWVRTNIIDSDFTRCVLVECRFVGESQMTEIKNCNFTNTNFSDSAITNIQFANCNFEGADFSNARLINVKFINCIKLDTALSTNVWLSKVEFLGDNKSELREPQGGWRYKDGIILEGNE